MQTLVRKGVSPLNFKIIPPFLKDSHPHTLMTNQPSQVLLINRNATMTLSLTKTIHVNQHHNVGYFSFKFTLKCMLGNVYINKIHANQCLKDPLQ